MFVVKFTQYCKLATVAMLRLAYGFKKDDNTYLFPDYSYAPNDADNDKLRIYRAFPQRVFRPPVLVVSAEASKASISYFHEELMDEVRNNSGEIISWRANGKLNVPIEITVFAKTTTDRENLTDTTTFCLRHLFKDKLAQAGIAYTNIAIGGETQAEWNNQPLYSNTVTIRCYTEYDTEIPVALMENIKNVNLETTVSAIMGEPTP